MQALLGSTLARHASDEGAPSLVDTETELKSSQYVGLYFSAHWCPPCKMFTPMLAESYQDLKKRNMEIVFVSSDKSESQFNEYYSQMPWLALPYSERRLKQKLSRKFKVQGIPSFVIVDRATGKLVTSQGRDAFLRDRNLTSFPWTEPTFLDVIDGSLLDKEGRTYDAATELKGKVVGLYFSASWCPPCRRFTPKLTQTYRELKQAGKPFEVVLVSGDQDVRKGQAYFNKMPWKAIPIGNDARIRLLNVMFRVEGIPALILVDGSTGKVLNEDAQGAVAADPSGAEFPWAPKPFAPLGPDNAQYINEQPCVLLFGDTDHKAATQAVQAVAERYYQQCEQKEVDPELKFFYIDSHNPLRSRLVSVLGTNDPVLVTLDVASGAAYHSTVQQLANVSPEAVQSYVNDILDDSVQGRPLSF